MPPDQLTKGAFIETIINFHAPFTVSTNSQIISPITSYLKKTLNLSYMAIGCHPQLMYVIIIISLINAIPPTIELYNSRHGR